MNVEYGRIIIIIIIIFHKKLSIQFMLRIKYLIEKLIFGYWKYNFPSDGRTSGLTSVFWESLHFHVSKNA